MRKVKWMFFGYIAFVVAMVAAIGFALNRSPARDPQTYYAAYSGAIKSLDPAEMEDELSGGILSYVFEALYNYKYKVLPYELYPELASAMPTVSPDGCTMTIPIRHGIHYYDPEKTLWPDGQGPEITAQDFVYSFKRVCDFHTQGSNYSFCFQDRVVGVNDFYAYTQTVAPDKVDYDRPIEGIKVDPQDKYTLILKFPTPYPQMIYNLVNAQCSPVSRQLVKYWKEEFRKHPVGTGPYALTEHLREQRITFAANPFYRGRSDIDGYTKVSDADRLPKIKRVQLDYFQEDLPVWLLFNEGLFDVNGIPKDAFKDAIGDNGGLTPEMIKNGVILQKHTDPTTEYIGFNMADPVVGKNKPLRQAMSLAFDRKTFIDKFSNGRGMPAIGIIPPGFPTFDEHRINPYTQFDLQAARKLMLEAVQVNGGPIPTLKILFSDPNTLNRQMAAFYVDAMAQIGVTLEPEYRDFARYLQMIDGRQFQIFNGGWQADYPDEQDFLQLFYGPSAAQGGLNTIAYRNPEFDKLYEKSITMQDTPQRRALYMQMQKILEDDCPWLLTDYPIDFTLLYNWIGNRFTMDYGHGFMEYETLDSSERARRIAKMH
jgi:ABC-type transport system substrate-binding protein